MIYEYKIGKNKRLGYNTDGYFWCPLAFEGKSKEGFIDRTKHNERVKSGEMTRKVLENRQEETPEGTITHFKELKYVATRKQPPFCRCGQEMAWKGYPVWYEYRDPKAKMIGGMFRMGTRDKRYWTKYFRTRKAREKFIARFLVKHKK